jgi:CBS domain-containing membrane protein
MAFETLAHALLCRSSVVTDELLFSLWKTRLKTLLRSFVPHPLNTHPAEWSRAAIGASLGVFICALASGYLFGTETTLHLLGPLGASSVLLFAVSSGALAQPWSIIGSYLTAALVGLASVHLLGHSVISASVAVLSSILFMCVFRCLHPPAAAVTIGVVLSSQASPGFNAVVPVMFNAACLLGTALVYNNLTRMRYPRGPAKAAPVLPSAVESGGVSSEDLDKALDEVGTFVDVSREDLEGILHKAEDIAQHRNRTDIDTRQIIERSTHSLSLDHSMADAMEMLGKQGGKYLPVLDAERKVIGIISLVG